MGRTEGDCQAERFEPLDLYQLAWASDPQLSPDRSQVAFLRNQPGLKTDRVRRSLQLEGLDGGGSQLLVDEAFEPIFPRWSPDGRRIALLTTSGGRQRIELIDAGGAGRCVFEPQGLVVTGLAWSPDSSAIAFAGRSEIVMEDRWSLPRQPDGADWAPRPVVIDRLPFRSDDQGPEKPFRSSIYLLTPADGEIATLTGGDHIDARDGQLAWTPDGEMVLFASNRESPAGVDAWDTRIYGVKTGSRAIIRLTLGGRDFAPAVSPDGASLAFLRREDLDATYTTPRLYLQAMAGGAPRRLAPELDCPLRDPRWTPDGRGVRALADRRGRTSIVEIGLDGVCRTLVEDVGGGWVRHPYLGGSFSQSESGALAFGSWSESRPPEVAVAASGAGETIVTRLNADWAEARDLGSISPVNAKSAADGASVEGWMLRPPGFDPARRYPMILDIHGGPWADYGPQFSVVSHLWAAAGYIVLFGNPRGSTSYGEAFASGINHAFPSIDYDDLMALTDAASPQGGWTPRTSSSRAGRGAAR